MTVLFAILTFALIAVVFAVVRGQQGVSVRQSDPQHERTAQWPGAVAGLAVFAVLAGVVFAMVQLGG